MTALFRAGLYTGFLFTLHPAERRNLLLGADLDDVQHVVDKDLAVADMAGVQDAACRFDDFVYRDLATTTSTFTLGSSVESTGAPVSFRGAFLNAAAHDLGHSHAGHADLIESPLKFVKFVKPAR